MISGQRALDSAFRDAVAAIDAGDVASLERLLAATPALVRERLTRPGAWLRDKVGRALDGFFRGPYLLWFVAEDPVRNGTLPPNIAHVARVIIQAAQRENVETLQEQLDYALRLVAWSGVAATCGVQNDLIDVLADAGASLDGVGDTALVNRHVSAAAHLVDRGAPLTLATALCLGRWNDGRRLAAIADSTERKDALVLACLNGHAAAIQVLIDVGIDVDTPSRNIYAHATPLHHAVCSGSLEAVTALVEAGANLHIKDRAEHATPRGWAEYFAGEATDEARKHRYVEIAGYLRQQESNRIQ
jgi:peptide-methionine (S)-S-oxide reductase